MEKFELTTIEHRRIKKFDSKTKMRLTVEKYVQGIQKLVRCILFFELCEFELKEFSCKGLLVNMKGPKNLFDLDDLSNYRSSNYMSSIYEWKKSEPFLVKVSTCLFLKNI